MAIFWDHGGDWRAPLDKYEALLEFAGRPSIDRSRQPYQDAAFLVKLRNLIVHFRPETSWISEDPHKLEKWLKGKFPDNQLAAGTGNSWWPDYCLGHGCSEWAHKAARAFVDHVVNEIGILPNYFGANFGPA
jgi:hypothetical protein